MTDDLQLALQAVDDAVAWVHRLAAGPVPLRAVYLAAIDRVERLPQNQSGADKTWMERARREFVEHFRQACRR
jgi:hypothetical protein